MAEIKINIDELNDLIVDLQNLQKKSSSFRENAPATRGGGQTVNEIEKIKDIYNEIDSNVEVMISNTVLFFKSVKDSYMSSDAKAARGITSK